MDVVFGRLNAAQFKAERVADNPMRRFGTLDEIATAAAFLAFDATYTAGVELAVDGGVTPTLTGPTPGHYASWHTAGRITFPSHHPRTLIGTGTLLRI
ncbi:SDR family oxidoreductase [Nonomuraea sp. NPDC049400]|uniref:SDR family oxidoreductase n=1 Tax=Nonomuraea sp. NPDC049400 TaxID=3364352 RepID=UPI00378FA122